MGSDFKKLIIFIHFILFSFIPAFSQYDVISESRAEKPLWVESTPMSQYYYYYVGIGTSNKSLEEAKSLSINDALASISLEDSIFISSNISTMITESNNEIYSNFRKDIKVSGSSSDIKGLKLVEEYWQQINIDNQTQFMYWSLLRVPQKGYEDFEITYVDPSHTIPIIKSIVLPGWGQYSNNHHTKGIILFSSTIISLSGAIATYNVGNNYLEKANYSSDINEIKWYKDQSDKYYAISNILFVVAGGIYVYNLFDIFSDSPPKEFVFDVPLNQFFVDIAVNDNNVFIHCRLFF